MTVHGFGQIGDKLRKSTFRASHGRGSPPLTPLLPQLIGRLPVALAAAIGKSFQTVYRQIKRNSEIDAS